MVLQKMPNSIYFHMITNLSINFWINKFEKLLSQDSKNKLLARLISVHNKNKDKISIKDEKLEESASFNKENKGGTGALNSKE